MNIKEYHLDSVYMETRDATNDAGWYYVTNEESVKTLIAEMLLLGATLQEHESGILYISYRIDGDYIMYMQNEPPPVPNSTMANYRVGVWQLNMPMYKKLVGRVL